MNRKEYSVDLRERVVSYIKDGNNQRQACELFKVSKSSVNRWWLRYKEEGSIAPRKRLGSKGKVDSEELRKYA
jgi:transposase